MRCFSRVNPMRSRTLPLLALLRASSSMSSAAGNSCSASASPLPFSLLQKTQQSPDSWLLRFALPSDRRYLGEDLSLPTCIKVLYPGGTDAKTGEPKPLEKSYSPVSHPAAQGEMELVVKEYSPRPGGGVGAYICGLEVGDSMLATVKALRMMHGAPHVAHRWDNVGLVGGGTGVAPLIQIARILLDDSTDRTRVQMLSINRREEDILMRQDLLQLAAAHPDRFNVSFSLTGSCGPGWSGHSGRGSPDMISASLPPPTGDGRTMILVCGTDGFVETWAGAVTRAPNKPDGTKGPKVQGPLKGLLAAAGYDASEVYKY